MCVHVFFCYHFPVVLRSGLTICLYTFATLVYIGLVVCSRICLHLLRQTARDGTVHTYVGILVVTTSLGNPYVARFQNRQSLVEGVQPSIIHPMAPVKSS